MQAAAFVTDAWDLYLLEWKKVISLIDAEFKSVISKILVLLLL